MEKLKIRNKIKMKAQLIGGFEKISSIENLLEAWREFAREKRGKRDVGEFSLNLMDNLLFLRRDLVNHTYRHGPYQAFNINDPKPRNIHKACVRDRVLHHAIYRVLYPFFDKTFVSDSFSCRVDHGTHKALDRFRIFTYAASRNNTRTCWILKCDIRKFFANIDHDILLGILRSYIPNEETIRLLAEVIGSFYTKDKRGKGLPLGNLTSQLFVNVYMNEFDRFMKHKLKAKHYIRYADDFVVLSPDREWIESLVPPIGGFLRGKLRLELHPDKVFTKTIASGVDFLGWIHFPDHRVLRTATKRRMMKKIRSSPALATINSYLGLLGHGNGNKLRSKILEENVFRKN